MSRIRHLVWPTQSDARNSSGDENARAANPNSLSKSGSDSRTDSSSSTTDTSKSVIFIDFHRFLAASVAACRDCSRRPSNPRVREEWRNENATWRQSSKDAPLQWRALLSLGIGWRRYQDQHGG